MAMGRIFASGQSTNATNCPPPSLSEAVVKHLPVCLLRSSTGKAQGHLRHLSTRKCVLWAGLSLQAASLADLMRQLEDAFKSLSGWWVGKQWCEPHLGLRPSSISECVSGSWTCHLTCLGFSSLASDLKLIALVLWTYSEDPNELPHSKHLIKGNSVYTRCVFPLPHSVRGEGFEWRHNWIFKGSECHALSKKKQEITAKSCTSGCCPPPGPP